MRNRQSRSSVRSLGRALAAVMMLVACKGRDDIKGLNGDSGTGMSPTPSGDTTAQGQRASASPAPTLNDSNIVALLDEANVADSSSGSVAASKGTSADVKEFGRMMMRDHHSMRQQGQSLAKSLGITPVPAPGDSTASSAKAWQDSLTRMPKGGGWDRVYIAHEVADHQKVLDLAQQSLGQAKHEELKQLIKRATPVIEAHLTRAQAIQKTLESSS
jgi:putative membrane protein